jgi:hypothetical protein
MKEILKMSKYKIIRTREYYDKARLCNERKRQFKLQILYNGKSVKSSYYLTEADRNTAYRMCKQILIHQGVINAI